MGWKWAKFDFQKTKRANEQARKPLQKEKFADLSNRQTLNKHDDIKREYKKNLLFGFWF